MDRIPILLVLVAGALVGAGCATAPSASPPDPAHTVPASPDYAASCAPSGIDSSTPCLELALAAVDHARSGEHLGPMALPATLDHLSVPEQVLVVVDRERVDRGLAPFTGLSAALDANADRGAQASSLPPDPGRRYYSVDTEWVGGSLNGIDVDYQWMYDDGPGSGTRSCRRTGDPGCWADRHIVLDTLPGPGSLVMGVAVAPAGDTSASDRGGPSLAATFARTAQPGPLVYTWAQAQAAMRSGTLRPRSAWPAHTSATGIPDPGGNVAPVPDYTGICAQQGLDSSPGCTMAVVAAIDSARAAEGVGPLRLPSDYAALTVPEQLLVVVDRERVDRGLRPFVGLTAALDANAAAGARAANDPPDPGAAYDVVDAEWAGGSVNALDAVYGWMYYDGYNSGNLDCPKVGSPGCWGHREGILDNFGTVGTMVMGAALDATGDTSAGDVGGTSMAATLAITRHRPRHYVYTWAQALAATP